MSFSNGLLEIQDGRGSLTASLSKYLKIGEIDYTELNNLSYVPSSFYYNLTASNTIPTNIKINYLYTKVNQPFLSASGSIDGVAFGDYPAGFTLSSFNFFSIKNTIYS